MRGLRLAARRGCEFQLALALKTGSQLALAHLNDTKRCTLELYGANWPRGPKGMPPGRGAVRWKPLKRKRGGLEQRTPAVRLQQWWK